MGMTIAEARTLVARHIHDPDKNRDGPDVIDGALIGQLISTLGWFADSGGLFYSSIIDATTAADGTLALASYAPVFIHGVSLDNGSGRYSPIGEQQMMNVRSHSQSARALRVVLTRTPATSGWATETNAFIDHTSSLENFERLVCAHAALELLASDSDQASAVRKVRDDYEKKVARMLRPGASSMPDAGASAGIAYAYRPDTQTLYLTRVVRRGRWR